MYAFLHLAKSPCSSWHVTFPLQCLGLGGNHPAWALLHDQGSKVPSPSGHWPGLFPFWLQHRKEWWDGTGKVRIRGPCMTKVMVSLKSEPALCPFSPTYLHLLVRLVHLRLEDVEKIGMEMLFFVIITSYNKALHTFTTLPVEGFTAEPLFPLKVGTA